MEYKNKKIYEEAPQIADKYRKQYVEGVELFLNHLNEEGRQKRAFFMQPEELVDRQEFYRKQYKQMLGLDRLEHMESVTGIVLPETEKIYVASDDVCDIYRLTVYVTKDIPFYALMLVPHGIEKAPLVVAQHGGGGSPEICSDIYGENNYNHMVQRTLERGAVVVAPQLMLWRQKGKNERPGRVYHDALYDREAIDNNLKRFGMSITALEVKAIMKCIDYALTLDCVDERRVGMIGLSYGGYYTLHTMAADTRIKAGFASGSLNDRDIYSWKDWCYKDSGNLFQDAEVAALCAPRKLYFTVGTEDHVFQHESAVKEAKRIEPYYQAYGCIDNLKFVVWDGGHTVPDDDEGYEFLFEELQ